jgi:hypothetical protein
MQLVEAAPELLGVTFAELAEVRVPEANASLVEVLETVWIEVIVQGSERPLLEIVEEALAARQN